MSADNRIRVVIEAADEGRIARLAADINRSLDGMTSSADRSSDDWLGDKTWLEGDRFTIGDLLMVTVLRFLRHPELVAGFPNLAAYVKRGEARPVFQRALADQLATFEQFQPQGEAA